MIRLREQSLTLDGEKEEQSCPNDKRNELCVSMAMKMKDDKITTSFDLGIFTFNQIIANLSIELSQFESAGYFKNRLELYD